MFEVLFSLQIDSHMLIIAVKYSIRLLSSWVTPAKELKSRLKQDRIHGPD